MRYLGVRIWCKSVHIEDKTVFCTAKVLTAEPLRNRSLSRLHGDDYLNELWLQPVRLITMDARGFLREEPRSYDKRSGDEKSG